MALGKEATPVDRDADALRSEKPSSAVTTRSSERHRSTTRPGTAPRYKMADLCARTGLPRQVVHFYIREGLLPEGRKTGKTMAYYADEHLERLRLIKRLQEERFLPLKAIKALFDEELEAFTPEQREHLAAMATHVRGEFSAGPTEGRAEALAVAREHGLDARDLDELAEVGILRLGTGTDGQRTLDRRDTALVALFAAFRRAGFTAELDFFPRDLAIYVEGIARIVRAETELLAARAARVAPERLARMLEEGLPIVHAIVAHHHENVVRDLLAALATPTTESPSQ